MTWEKGLFMRPNRGEGRKNGGGKNEILRKRAGKIALSCGRSGGGRPQSKGGKKNPTARASCLMETGRKSKRMTFFLGAKAQRGGFVKTG